MRAFLKCVILILAFPLLAAPAFADYPQRIVSGMPSITEMLYALELDSRIVGVTTNCNYPPRAEKKEKVGGFFLNLEKIVSLKPDLVIMLNDAQKKEIKRFKDYGLPVYTIDPRSVNGVMDSLLRLGEKCGKGRKAQQVVREMRQRLEKVRARVNAHRPSLAEVLQIWNRKTKERKALVIVGFDPLVAAGRGTFINDILKHAGLENAARRARAAYPHYSFEKLLADNPQYIIIPKGLVSEKRIKKDKRWMSLEAIRNNRVLFIDKDILSRPGPRVVEAIEKIVEFVYY